MKNYHFYLCYTHHDRAVAEAFRQKIESKGFSVYTADTGIAAGMAFAAETVKVISSCDNFVLFLSQHTMRSELVLTEINVAIERNKTIIPIALETFDASENIHYCLKGRAFLRTNGTDGESIDRAVDEIDTTFGGEIRKNALYEKLSEYEKIKDENGRALTLTDIILAVGEEFKRNERRPHAQRKLAKELYSLYESLSSFVGSYDPESKRVAITVMEKLHEASKLFTLPVFLSDPFYAAVALSCIYF